MNIGFFEIGVIFVLALLVFGPRKLPEIAKILGKAMRMFREASDEVRRTLEEDIRVEEHKKIFTDVGREVSTELKNLTEEEPEPKEKKKPATAELPNIDTNEGQGQEQDQEPDQEQ